MPANLTRAEAEARAALVSVERYDVAIDLTRGDTRFGSETVVTFTATEGASTFIEATAETVREVVLNGRALDVADVFAGDRIRLDGLADENELRVVFDGAYTNTGEGLHRFVDPVDDAVYLYTEFAVAQANRVFAVFDQPDLKARFRFTITAPEDWQVLGNASTPLATEAVADGAAVWEFEDTPVMSSYIVALVAGPYAVWRDTAELDDGRVVPLGVFTRASLAQYADPEFMFETVRRGIRFYAGNYGVPFPYDKYDQIFVPEYNWGAMENIGAVTFNEGYLFRSRVPESRKERRTLVVLHELAHMWFGNLVTMKWWNDLWLNESFATWASTLATAELSEFTDAWATFATTDKSNAARQDQLPSTHPIVAEITDLADVEVNFDAITYDKGASTLKQLVAWVGLDAFHAGVGAYLRAHAEGNATLADLLAELETASGRDLAAWSRAWLETAGVNTLRTEIETDASGTITSFAIVQEAAASHPVLRPHRIAVGAYSRGDEGVVREQRIELDVDGARTEVPELVGTHRPDLVLLNDDDLTYAKVRLDQASTAFALEHLGEIADPVARAVVWGAAWDATRDAELPASDFVRLVIGNLGHETTSSARTSALARLQAALERYVAVEQRERLQAEAGDALWGLVQLAPEASDAQLQYALGFARIASTPAHADVLASLVEGTTVVDGLEVDTELRWELVIALAALGAADDALIDRTLAGDDTAKGRQQAATARAARPDSGSKDAAWLAVATDTSLSNDVARAIAAGYRRAHPETLLESRVGDYFAMLRDVWAGRSFTMADLIVTGLFPAPVVTDETAAAAAEWLAANADAPAPLRRLVAEGHAELVRALAARARDRAAADGGRA
ncbi:aminopeptidase N [Agromyces mangrovi Wang et al. 2018]|uniref:aminopeptidase N n=1 Tax=Agromyces mangrovi TaxID=1858653 RepID=UPI0025732D99|nr:aminopeptidase N [Agromyces mangrovi]BDZ63152.1 aminopeptidase N [Agromyces mangrovi]